jgi:hypothetical protein
MEQEYKDYKAFGLYKRQSIIGFFFALIVHTFTCAYSIYSKVDFEEYKTLSSNQINNLYEWYIYYPTIFLIFFFLGRFFDYLLRDKKYKEVIGFLFTIIVSFICLILFRALFLVMLFWNQI